MFSTHKKITRYISHLSYLQGFKSFTQPVGKSLGKQVLLDTAGGNTNWCNSSGEELGNTWWNSPLTYLLILRSHFRNLLWTHSSTILKYSMYTPVSSSQHCLQLQSTVCNSVTSIAQCLFPGFIVFIRLRVKGAISVSLKLHQNKKLEQWQESRFLTSFCGVWGQGWASREGLQWPVPPAQVQGVLENGWGLTLQVGGQRAHPWEREHRSAVISHILAETLRSRTLL